MAKNDFYITYDFFDDAKIVHSENKFSFKSDQIIVCNSASDTQADLLQVLTGRELLDPFFKWEIYNEKKNRKAKLGFFRLVKLPHFIRHKMTGEVIDWVMEITQKGNKKKVYDAINLLGYKKLLNSYWKDLSREDQSVLLCLINYFESEVFFMFFGRDFIRKQSEDIYQQFKRLQSVYEIPVFIFSKYFKVNRALPSFQFSGFVPSKEDANDKAA